MNTSGIITGIGAANMDVHGLSRRALVDHDSNPGRIRLSAGGVTRNMLENLARMGAETRLLTAVGDDPFGREILHSVKELGCDISHAKVCPGHTSSTYMAVLDATGDMRVAVSDMHILEELTPQWLDTKLDVIRNSAAIVLDPCLPDRVLAWLTDGKLAGIPIFADPVSTAYARRIRPYVGAMYCLKPNCLELEALTGVTIRDDRDIELAVEALLVTGLHRVVVSLGRRGSYWADRDGIRQFLHTKTVENMVCATGAGDSFLSGLVYAYSRGMTPQESLEWASACGSLTIMSAEAVNKELSPVLIRKKIMEMKS